MPHTPRCSSAFFYIAGSFFNSFYFISKVSPRIIATIFQEIGEVFGCWWNERMNFNLDIMDCYTGNPIWVKFS